MTNNPRLLEQAGKLFWLFPKNQTLEREADSQFVVVPYNYII